MRKGEKAKGACCCNKLKPCGNCATPVSLAGWLPAHLLQGIVLFVYKKDATPFVTFHQSVPAFCNLQDPAFLPSVILNAINQFVCSLPKTCFPCSVVYLGPGQGAHCQTDLCSCAHECGTQYSLQRRDNMQNYDSMYT